MSDITNSLRPSQASTKWQPIAGAKLKFDALPGWVLLLTHNGERSLGVWTNGRAVWAVAAGQA